MAAPTFIASTWSTWTSVGGATRTTVGSLSWLTGDLIVVFAFTEDTGTTNFSNSPSGTNLSFGALSGTPTTGGSQTKAYAWSAVATGSGSGTFSLTVNDITKMAGLYVVQYRNTNGLGNMAVNVATGAFTQSLTRSAANSMVAQMMGDWGANAPGTPTATPTGTVDQALSDAGSGGGAHATFYGERWGDQGSIGSLSYGVTGPSSTSNVTGVIVEILGIPTVTPAHVFPPTPDKGLSIQQRMG